MKYVVNTRGRAIERPDEELESLLAHGFVQITKSQFDSKKYYPEYDRGEQSTFKANPFSPPANQRQNFSSDNQPSKDLTRFRTKVV